LNNYITWVFLFGVLTGVLMSQGDGIKYYVMLRMEGDFPSGYDTLKWEIGEVAYEQ
jgi:hypothetical protein